MRRFANKVKRFSLPALIGMVAVWLMLWGSLSPLTFIGGVIFALLIIWIFPFPPVDISGNFRPWQFLVLVVKFLADLVVASFQVAWIAIRPQSVPQSALIEVHLVSESDLMQTITSELISLVPGSLLIELDHEGKRLWLHVLNASTPELIEDARRKARAQEHRLIAAVGSRAEYDASLQEMQEERV